MTSARRFVLLDRDGTVNVERDYLSDPAGVALYPGVGAALRCLVASGFGLAVVTNQSGLARGYFDEAALARVHARLIELLAAEGVTLDGIYVCPHAPDAGCRCRKPNPGLVEQAVAELGFDPRDAFVVGDKMADIELAHHVGAAGILVLTGHGPEHASAARGVAEAVVPDLPAAVRWIEDATRERTP